MNNISSWIAKWNLGDGQYLTAIRVIKKIGNLSDGQYLTAIASTKISKKTRGSCKQRDLGPKYEFMPHFNKKRQGTYLRCFEIQNWGFFRGNFEFGNSTHPSTIKKKGKKVESQIFLKQIFFCASLCACCSRPSLLCPMRGNNDHFSHSTRTPLTHLLQPKSSRCILPRRKNPRTERKAKKKRHTKTINSRAEFCSAIAQITDFFGNEKIWAIRGWFGFFVALFCIFLTTPIAAKYESSLRLGFFF